MPHLEMQEVHSIKFSINIAEPGAEESWAVLGAGIENMQEQLNEVIQQYKFMKDEGYGRSRVTAMAPVWNITGRRIWGDAAQDFIFKHKYSLGAGRETDAKVEYTANGMQHTITFDVTFANLQEIGGATEENSAISIEMHVAGKPVMEN